MIENCPAAQNAARQEMKPAAQTIRDRLRLEVIVERAEIAPALVATDFDHAGAKHDSKNQCAKKPDDDEWRRPPRERPPIEQRAKKDGEKAGVEQLHFPALAVPFLPDVDEGHVENPEQSEQNRIGVSAHHDARKRHSNPRSDEQSRIGRIDPEKRWQTKESA